MTLDRKDGHHQLHVYEGEAPDEADEGADALPADGATCTSADHNAKFGSIEYFQFIASFVNNLMAHFRP